MQQRKRACISRRMKTQESWVKMIQVFKIMICIILCWGFHGNVASAETQTYQLGDNVIGTLTDDGTLTVSGIGEMYDYSDWGYNSPFYENSLIKKVVIQDGVTYIGMSTFTKCYWIQHVDIAGSVKVIGSNAFIWDSGIESVILPEGVEELKYFCFGHCSGLKYVSFPQSLRNIEGNVFYGCFALEDVSLPSKLETIGGGVFGACRKITELTIPASVSNIGGSLFESCPNLMEGEGYSLQNIYVDAGNPIYQSIDGVVYSKDGKTLLWYPEGRKSSFYRVQSGTENIGCHAFSNEFLQTVDLPDSMTRFEDYAFSDCKKLEDVNLPENLTYIGECAFENTHIKNMVVPQRVAFIGYLAFADCQELRDIWILNPSVQILLVINGGIFDGCSDDLAVHIHEGSTTDIYMDKIPTAGNRVYDVLSYQFNQVSEFVSRMYTVALGRAAEEVGLNDWTNRLLNHEVDGAGIANGFIMSEEFANKKVSDSTYVDILYHTFFDREADEGGRATWLEKLANGNSRSFVLAGFVNSVEFDNLCNRYGIVRGTMYIDETPATSGVRDFVERCYNKVLNREGEKAGVDDWTDRIIRGEQTPESTAKLFFFSEEYANKHTDNEEFVETLYQTFMDRASDPAGKSDWVGRLAGGMSREEVLEGFSRSVEFAEIMKSFGL